MHASRAACAQSAGRASRSMEPIRSKHCSRSLKVVRLRLSLALLFGDRNGLHYDHKGCEDASNRARCLRRIGTTDKDEKKNRELPVSQRSLRWRFVCRDRLALQRVDEA